MERGGGGTPDKHGTSIKRGEAYEEGIKGWWNRGACIVRHGSSGRNGGAEAGSKGGEREARMVKRLGGRANTVGG